MKTIQLSATMESLEPLEAFVLEPARALGAPAEMLGDMRLVLEEVLVNIISYGYPGSRGDIRVDWTADENGTCRIRIRDWGVPFNPLEAPAPDLDVDFTERTVGGLGILLVRQLAHDVWYERDDDSNVLTLCFQLRS